MTRLRILLRTGKIMTRDKRIPRWLRWGIVASVAIPLPGPIDEGVALVLVLVVCLFWRVAVREAYAKASLATPAKRLRQETGQDVMSVLPQISDGRIAPTASKL